MQKTLPIGFFVAAAILGAAVFVQPGCIVVAAGAAGAGAVAYVRGDLQATLDATYDRSVRAAKAGIERMKFNLISESSDALNTVLVARTAHDKKVEVRVTKQSEKSTALRIRVGVFGDEEISRALLESIQSRL